MARTQIRGGNIKDETIESVDLASGSIKAGELSTDVITSQTAEASVASDDLVLIYDTSETAFRKMTKANFTAGVTADPAGSDTQVQFNDGGSTGGDAGLIFDKSSGILTVAKGAVFNEGSHDSDFRVESNDDANMLFVNAGTNRVGIGTDAPTALLHISSSAIGVLFRIDHPDAGIDNPIFFVTGSSGNSRVGIGTETPDATFAISDNGKVLEVGSADEGSWLEVNNGTVYLNLGGGKTIAGGDDLGQRFNISPINATAGALGIGKYPEATVNIVEVNSANSDQGGDFFVIDSDGQVGIGKTSPTSPLHVYSNESGNYAALIDNDNASSGHGLKVTSDGTGTGTNLLDVEAASTTVFRVRGDGRVGIGKVASLPAAVLTVSSSNTDGDIAIAHKIQHIGDDDTFIEFQTDNINIQAGGVDFIKITEDDSQDMIVFNEGSADVDFRVESNNKTHAIFVDAGNDRVAIGHSTPDAILHIDNGTSNTEVIIEKDAGTSGSIVFHNAGDRAAEIAFSTNEDIEITNRVADKDIIFTANDNSAGAMVEVMRIDGSTARVGISTTTPSTLLDVSGSAKANTFVTTPYLTDLGSGTATHLTSSNGVHFLDADSVTLESGKNYHELYLAPGSTNGQHIQLTITGSANNPVRIVGSTGGAKATGTITSTGVAANGQSIALKGPGGSTSYTISALDDAGLPCGSAGRIDATTYLVGINGCTSAAQGATGIYTALAAAISQDSWPFTLGAFTLGASTVISLTATAAGTASNQTTTENMDNTTVLGFSGGSALATGTLNSTYGVALAGTSANGSLIQGAHLIYDSNSEQWQIIAGTQLTS